MAGPLWNGVPFCGCSNAGASFLLIEVVIEFEIFFVNLIRPVFNTEDADGSFAVAEFDGIDETLMCIEVHGFPFVGILAAREVVEAAAQRDERLFEQDICGERQEYAVKTDIFIIIFRIVVLFEQFPLSFIGGLKLPDMVGGELAEDFIEAVGLDGTDDLVRAFDEILRDGVDVDALAGQDGYEAFRFEADKGVAQGCLTDFEGFTNAVLIEEFAIPQVSRTHGVLEVLIDTLAEGIGFWILARYDTFTGLLGMVHPRPPVIHRYMRLPYAAWIGP